MYLDGSNVGQNFTAGYTLYNYVCIKKKKIGFCKTDNGQMLKYRSISTLKLRDFIVIKSNLKLLKKALQCTNQSVTFFSSFNICLMS